MLLESEGSPAVDRLEVGNDLISKSPAFAGLFLMLVWAVYESLDLVEFNP